MNRFSLTLFLTLALGITFTQNATAQSTFKFDIVRVVDSILSTTEKLTFDISETPTLYVKLSKSGSANVSSFWKAPYGSEFLAQNTTSNQERWLQLANWNTVKAGGQWDINTNVFFPNGSTDTANVSFTVTPEPLSTGLFLLGGAPIAAHIYRRRKAEA